MTAHLPAAISNADSKPYWEAAAQGRLLLRTCRACGKKHFMPRFACPACWSSALEWTESSGKGVIHTFTVIRRAPLPAFSAQVPYVVALVELEEGPRMIANLRGAGALAARIGDPVQVVFEEREGGGMIPQFMLQSVAAS